VPKLARKDRFQKLADSVLWSFEGGTPWLSNALACIACDRTCRAVGHASPRTTATVDFAATHRLPAIDHFRRHADAGGLMSYGPSHADPWRRSTTYVDKLMRGANPADLPVEQPMTVELVINLKRSKDVGLMISPALLFQVTEVIR
jgi:hypothetical protein